MKPKNKFSLHFQRLFDKFLLDIIVNLFEQKMLTWIETKPIVERFSPFFGA